MRSWLTLWEVTHIILWLQLFVNFSTSNTSVLIWQVLNMNSEEEGEKSEGGMLMGFLFGNIDEKGRLQDDVLDEVWIWPFQCWTDLRCQNFKGTGPC